MRTSTAPITTGITQIMEMIETPDYCYDPEGDDDERLPPNFTDDSDTIHEDDDLEESEA